MAKEQINTSAKPILSNTNITTKIQKVHALKITLTEMNHHPPDVHALQRSCIATHS